MVMVAVWFWEQLREWPPFVGWVLIGVGLWFVTAFGHGFANKLGEEAATDAWQNARRRMGRRDKENPTDEDS